VLTNNYTFYISIVLVLQNEDVLLVMQVYMYIAEFSHILTVVNADYRLEGIEHYDVIYVVLYNIYCISKQSQQLYCL
jgi:hypothetical protein